MPRASNQAVRSRQPGPRQPGPRTGQTDPRFFLQPAGQAGAQLQISSAFPHATVGATRQHTISLGLCRDSCRQQAHHRTVSRVWPFKPLAWRASSQSPHRVNSPFVKETKVKARWTWRHAGWQTQHALAALSRKMQQDRSDLSIQTGLFGSMFYIKLLPAFTAIQMSSLQPTQWERRQAPSEKDRLALCWHLQQSVHCNITIRKAHWNSSNHHPP